MSAVRGKPHKMTFTLYKAKDGHRWRCKSANGKIVADGGEAYTRRSGARHSLASFIDHVLSQSYNIIEE